MYRVFISLSLLFSLKLFGIGAWYKKTEQIPKAAQGSFTPSFVILKTGSFSKTGSLGKIELKDKCSNLPEAIAWVTHRLSQGETLTYEAGKNLGNALSQNLILPCVSGVELDIEPLSEARDWLGPFLKGVKEALNPKLKLRLAVPILSPRNLTGNFWTLRDGVRAMEWVDGLDVMAYDSGAHDVHEFTEIFKNTFFFVMELVKQSPDKDIIVGLPAYQDRTALHRLEAENLRTVLATLKQFTPFQLKPVCSGKIRMAYYSGWTLTLRDQETHQQIEDWIHETCKKPS